MFKPCLITKGYYVFFGGSGVRKTSARSSLQKPWRLWLGGVSLCSDSLIFFRGFPWCFGICHDWWSACWTAHRLWKQRDSDTKAFASEVSLVHQKRPSGRSANPFYIHIHSLFQWMATQNEGRVSTVGQSVGWSVGGFQHAGGLGGYGIWVLRNGIAFWHSNIQFRKTIVYWSCLIVYIVCELGCHGLFFRLDSRSGMVWVWFPWGLQEERRRKPHGHQGVLPGCELLVEDTGAT